MTTSVSSSYTFKSNSVYLCFKRRMRERDKESIWNSIRLCECITQVSLYVYVSCIVVEGSGSRSIVKGK